MTRRNRCLWRTQRSGLVVTLLLDQYFTGRRLGARGVGGKQGRPRALRRLQAKSATDNGWELGRCRLKVYCIDQLRFHLKALTPELLVLLIAHAPSVRL